MPNNDAHNSYFDEAYYERGWERGTAYSDYSRGAVTSKTFLEIAESIKYIFQPRRVLEIGCATGAIVRNLNALGVEAHGIDVSEWAVDHRLDEHVLLAGADGLPFPDGYFDLVFSSHSLEHLPAEIAEASFAEMTRVCAPEGTQFHMLPIVGTHPYDQDEEEARRQLRKDPTHNILETMNWWLTQWGRLGWRKNSISISYFNDAGAAELSSGQYCLWRQENPGIAERAGAWNTLVHRRLFTENQSTMQRANHPVSVATSLETFGTTIDQQEPLWRDAVAQMDPSPALADAIIHLTVDLKSSAPVLMRVALVDDSVPNDRGVLEWWFEAPVGVWSLEMDPRNFTTLSGKPDLAKVTLFLLGGTLENAVLRVAAVLAMPSGVSVQII